MKTRMDSKTGSGLRVRLARAIPGAALAMAPAGGAIAQPNFTVIDQNRSVSASMQCNCQSPPPQSFSAPNFGSWSATANVSAQNCPPPGGGGGATASQLSVISENRIAGSISMYLNFDAGCGGTHAAACSITFVTTEPQPYVFSAALGLSGNISLSGVFDFSSAQGQVSDSGTLPAGTYTFTLTPLAQYGSPRSYTYSLQIGPSIPAPVIAGPFLRPGDPVRSYYQLGGSTWEEAQAGALALGGHLVTTTDLPEHTWLQSTFGPIGPPDKWIGLNSLASPGTTTFGWISGNGLTITRWGPFPPAPGNGNYVYSVNAGSWVQTTNSPPALIGGIAEVVDPSRLPPIVAGPFCHQDPSREYYVLGPSNYFDGEEHAARLGGHLVTINDAAEQARITSTAGSLGTSEKWIGLTSLPIRGNSSFRWLSTQPVGYTSWLPGLPVSGNGNFVFMQSGGMWNQTVDGTTVLTRGSIIEVPVSACHCDRNRDGERTSADFFTFLADFFGGTLSSDYDCSGTVDSVDFFTFLTCFLEPECK